MKLRINPVFAWLAYVAVLTVLGLALMSVTDRPKQAENWIWSNRWPGDRQPRSIDTRAQEAEDTETPQSGRLVPD